MERICRCRVRGISAGHGIPGTEPVRFHDQDIDRGDFHVRRDIHVLHDACDVRGVGD